MGFLLSSAVCSCRRGTEPTSHLGATLWAGALRAFASPESPLWWGLTTPSDGGGRPGPGWHH